MWLTSKIGQYFTMVGQDPQSKGYEGVLVDADEFGIAFDPDIPKNLQPKGWQRTGPTPEVIRFMPYTSISYLEFPKQPTREFTRSPSL